MANTRKGMTDLNGVMAMGASVAIGFVVLVVVLSLGGSLLASMNTNITNGTTAAQILQNGTSGILQVGLQTQTMGLVVGIVIVLMVLIGGLGAFLFVNRG